MDEREEERSLHKTAEKLQAAIAIVLFCQNNPGQLRAANGWITTFLTSPLAWSVSLYLAFPPQGADIGLQQEVRFFSLNLLLSKIRTDWLQIEAADAQEIYDVLLRQLPLHRHDKIVGPRLCVVVAAAAALVGADACYELVENAVGESELEMALKVDLLTALAEETLHRGRGLSWMVRDCMQDCCPQVLGFLKSVVSSCGHSEILGHVFTCFERWIPAGVVLSELHNEHMPLFTSLLESFGSPVEAVFQAAVWAFSELISQVDILPGREAAITTIVKALLANKWQYDAAARTQDTDQSAGLLVRARGFCLLVSELGSIEGALLCRSGVDGVNMLQWLVDASRGGGGLGLEGALMAVEAWPRLASLQHARRGELLQASLFGAVAQAILQAAKYPQAFESWDDMSLEEEYFSRFRVQIAEGALVTVFKELGGMFLSILSEILNGATMWQDAEVCLFATTSISKEVMAILKYQNHNGFVEISFLTRMFTWLLGLSSSGGGSYIQNEIFLETSLTLLESYAEWVASQGNLVQQTIQYVIAALSVDKVRVKAACALKTICCSSAQYLAVSWPLDMLIGSCEAALSVPTELSKEEENKVHIAVVQGLASVIATLPSTDAERSLARLTFGAVSLIKNIDLTKGNQDHMVATLDSALRVVSAAVEFTFGNARGAHPALHLLQEIWPVLESLTVTWAANAVVAAALCDLWGIVASKVGVSFVEVLPGIIGTASSMFKLHRVASPLMCLSKVVGVVSLRPTPELEKCLSVMLMDVASMLQGIDRIMDEADQRRRATGTADTNNQEESQDFDFGSSLCMVYELGQKFLQCFPALILASGAFLQLFCSATGSLSREDSDVALAASNFLSDSILGPKGAEKGMRTWKLSQELMVQVDRVVGYYGILIVQALLRQLAVSGVVESLKEALVDVLYGLCICYPVISEAALISTLNAPDFPGRPGFSTDADKKQFLAAVLRQPSHPRVRFQDLMRIFSGVCQTVTSAQALKSF